MQQRQPTKEDILEALRRIAAVSPDGRVSHRVFKEETGWGRYWFDRHWPAGGYQAACEEAGVQRGAIIGIDTSTRVSDEELALKFADAVQSIGRVPALHRFIALARLGTSTITRGETYDDAKRRIIAAYFKLSHGDRKHDTVERILLEEFKRLGGTEDGITHTPTGAAIHRVIQVPAEFISVVHEFRDRGEEEKRQLVAQFFHDVLGYRRGRVHSEDQRNDVRVHGRRDQPWLVVEVKPRLETGRDRRAARRQAFDYAHRLGTRFVVISDGDYYEIYDRCAGDRLRYDEMRQGSFHISAIRTRDADLLTLLAAER